MYSKNLEEGLKSLIIDLANELGIKRICLSEAEIVFIDRKIILLTAEDEEEDVSYEDLIRTFSNPIRSSSSGKSDS